METKLIEVIFAMHRANRKKMYVLVKALLITIYHI